MIYESCEKIGQWRFVRALRSFFSSPWFIAMTCLVMVFSNIFSLELAAFYYFLLTGVLIVLFAEDLRGIVPIVLCAYMSISERNNPSWYPETSAFYDPAFKAQMIFIIVILSLLFLFRLISKLIAGQNRKRPKLAFGFLALGLSFLSAGLFSPYYSFKTVFFGFVEIAALSVFYFLFFFSLDWEEMDKRYLFYVLAFVGMGIFVEIIGIYIRLFLTNDFSQQIFNRGKIFTGWGIYNNIGCAVAMCLPGPLYLAVKEKKYGWCYLLCALVLVVALLLTQSRGSILFGGIVFAAGLVLTLVFCEKRRRIEYLIILGSFAVVAVIGCAVFWNQLQKLFESLPFNDFFGSNGRTEIYKDGWQQFLNDPIFGVGFYGINEIEHKFLWGNLPEGAFFPARYHNTYIQLLASGGIFAMGCYLFHRFETIIVFFKKPSKEKLFLFLSVAALILTSIVDCHFFNFGPGLIYGIVLVFAERMNSDEKIEVA